MPHIIVEFSSNLATVLDKHDFMQVIRDAVVETGVFPIGGIRVRLYEVSDYVIADGAPDNGFIHICLRIGTGRTETVKKEAAEHIFTAAEQCLNDLFGRHPLGLSLELSEIASATSFKRNNIHQYVEQRMAGTERTDSTDRAEK